MRNHKTVTVMNFDMSPKIGKFLLIVFVLRFCFFIPVIVPVLVVVGIFLFKYFGIPIIKVLAFVALCIIIIPVLIIYKISYKRSMRKYGIEPFTMPFYISGYKQARKEHKEYCAKIDRKIKMARLREEVGRLSKFRCFVRKILRRVRIERYRIIHNNIIELSVPNLTGLFAILVIGVVSISFIAFILIRNI